MQDLILTIKQKRVLIMEQNIMLGQVPIDRNFYHMTDVKYFVDRINELMVLDITARSERQSDNTWKTYLKIEALHMDKGITEHRMIVHGLNEHNCNLLHEYISDYLNTAKKNN